MADYYYTEEETFWIYANNYPKTRRSTSLEAMEFVKQDQIKNPTCSYLIVKETRKRQELQKILPLKSYHY